jgi:C4-dicarboxylate-binding protein DctP
MQTLGALPQVLAFSEACQALRTGVVDGTENTPSNIWSQKIPEVQKYPTVSDHGHIGYAVITHKTFRDGMPPDIRTILEGAMKAATRFVNADSQQENDDALAKIKASGRTEIIVFTAAQKAGWRKALQPVYAEMAPRVGRDLIDAIWKEAVEVGRSDRRSMATIGPLVAVIPAEAHCCPERFQVNSAG